MKHVKLPLCRLLSAALYSFNACFLVQDLQHLFLWVVKAFSLLILKARVLIPKLVKTLSMLNEPLEYSSIW